MYWSHHNSFKLLEQPVGPFFWHLPYPTLGVLINGTDSASHNPASPLKDSKHPSLKATYIGTPCQNMDPGVECEFQINTRSPLRSSPFFRRGPQKLHNGSRKDGWSSAACSTFFTEDKWWVFLWQVSVLLQAKTSETGRTAPWRRALFRSNDRQPLSFRACATAPSEASATDRLHKKRDHFKETRCAPVSAQNETPSTSPRMSSLSESPQRCGAEMQPKQW